MAYAIASDVESRLGRVLTAVETGQVETFLDDVEAMIRVRLPNLDAQVTANTVSLRNVVAVEAAAVRRVMLNPEGMSQEAIDGWSGQRNSAVAGGLLYVSDPEWSSLSVLIAGRRRGSIRLIANGEAWYGQPYVPPVFTP